MIDELVTRGRATLGSYLAFCGAITLVAFACDRGSEQSSGSAPRDAVPEDRIQLPEYYGIYAFDGGKTIELKEGAQVDLSPKAEFIIFHKAVVVALGLGQGIKLKRTEPSFFWDKAPADIECRMKPVEGKDEMVRVVPARDLEPGAYQLVGHAVVEFTVHKACYERIVSAQDHERANDWDEVIRECDEAIRLKPNYSNAYVLRGKTCSMVGDHRHRAIHDYNEAIRLNPDYAANAYILVSRGDAHAMSGDRPRAIRDYDEAVLLEPDDWSAYQQRGQLYQSMGDYDQAIRDFGECVRRAPNYPRFYSLRAFAYSAKGDYDRAISDFTEAIRLKPEAVLHYNLGRLLRLRGAEIQNPKMLDEAVAQLREAVRLEPRETRAYDLLV